MKPFLVFIFATFGFSWTVAYGIHAAGGLSNPFAGLWLLLYMCGPAIGALLCALFFHKGERLHVLGLKGGLNLWLLWAWLIGVVLVLGATLLSTLGARIALQSPLVGVKAAMASLGQDARALPDIPGLGLLIVLQAAFLGALINTPLVLSEELGWRGWLWHHVRPHGFWTGALIIGVLWGLWHAPIIYMGYNYPGMPVSGPILFTVFCILYAPVFSLVRERNGSVWAACVLHGTGNALAGVGLMALTHADMPWRGFVGIGGFAMLAAVTFWVVFHRKTNPLVTKDA